MTIKIYENKMDLPNLLNLRENLGICEFRHLHEYQELKGKAGIYEIFYHGDYPLYGPVTDNRLPIYIGVSSDVGSRIAAHIVSIITSLNLDLQDFSFKFLIPRYDGICEEFEKWIKNNEKPIWNYFITGFGNGPTMGRPKFLHSEFDWFHGREKFRNLPPPGPFSSLEGLIKDIREYYISQGYVVTWTVDDILALTHRSPTPRKVIVERAKLEALIEDDS